MKTGEGENEKKRKEKEIDGSRGDQDEEVGFWITGGCREEKVSMAFLTGVKDSCDFYVHATSLCFLS